jgi:putative acetyltransferase
MLIRLAQETDLAELAALYQQSVRVVAPQHYTPEQTHMWAASVSDAAHFCRFILDATTYVAEDHTGIVGFAGIADSGHITATYVRHDCIRQGIGSTLMEVILEHASSHQIQRLYSEASEFSVGLFKKFGFRVYDIEVIERQGVEFQRYLMER